MKRQLVQIRRAKQSTSIVYLYSNFVNENLIKNKRRWVGYDYGES